MSLIAGKFQSWTSQRKLSFSYFDVGASNALLKPNLVVNVYG